MVICYLAVESVKLYFLKDAFTPSFSCSFCNLIELLTCQSSSVFQLKDPPSTYSWRINSESWSLAFQPHDQQWQLPTSTGLSVLLWPGSTSLHWIHRFRQVSYWWTDVIRLRVLPPGLFESSWYPAPRKQASPVLMGWNVFLLWTLKIQRTEQMEQTIHTDSVMLITSGTGDSHWHGWLWCLQQALKSAETDCDQKGSNSQVRLLSSYLSMNVEHILA